MQEQFINADMELHRTIWKAANQPLLYRTLNLLMNPYIFMIARAYSSRIPLAQRRENHEHYVRMFLKTPLDRIENEVERYFDELYARTFEQGPTFPTFAADLSLPKIRSAHIELSPGLTDRGQPRSSEAVVF